jgi:RHS repeat-associated protein
MALSFVSVFAASLHLALAQDVAGLEQGIKPYGSYHGGDIDSVSMVNGSLSIHIPLVSYPQRGGRLHLGFELVYATPFLSAHAGGQTCPKAGVCYPTGIYYAPPSQTLTDFRLLPDFYPQVRANYLGDKSSVCWPGNGQTFNGGCSPIEPTFYDYSVVESDGAVHHLGQTGVSSWISRDATGYALNTTVTAANTMALIDRNGIRYTGAALPAPTLSGNPIGPATCCGPFTSIEDPNGNFLTGTYPAASSTPDAPLSPTVWTDTLGRSIPEAPNGAPSDYRATTDFAGCTGPLPTYEAFIWSLPGPNGGTSIYKVCYTTGSFSFPVAGGTQCGTTPIAFCVYSGYNKRVLQSVVLPNNTSWAFAYDNVTGALSQITFPTGGTISYTWTTATTCTGPQALGLYPTYSLVVTSRTVNSNDGTIPHTWHYTYTTAGDVNYPSSYQTIVTDPLGNDTTHTMTTLGASCVNIFETGAYNYSGSYTAGTLLKTTITGYGSTADPYVLADASGYNYSGGYSGSVMNVVPTSIATTESTTGSTAAAPVGPSDLLKKSYDSGIGIMMLGTEPLSVSAIYGNVMQESEYDYGPTSGAPGNLLRTTTTTYAALSGTNSAQYLANNLLSLQSSVKVQDASGSPPAYTQYNYDETALAYSGFSPAKQLDNAPPSGTYRGNLTSTLISENTATLPCSNGSTVGAGGNLTSRVFYYDDGMVQSKTNPCNITSSTYSNSSAYWGAFPTTVTNAKGQSLTYGYDLNTGEVTSVTDPNSNTISYGFDEMGRLASISYPDGGQVDISHQEQSTPFSATASTLQNATESKVETYIFDGLGRPIQSQITSDPQGTVLVDTTYDALGRVASVSNPYRSKTETTYGLTSYLYDALGHKVLQTQPDGYSQQWCYNGLQVNSQPNCFGHIASSTGAWVDSVDEFGNDWQNSSDALGRLTSVIEPKGTPCTPGATTCSNGSIAAPNLETDYSYSALGNLISMKQWGGASGSSGAVTRTFNYDTVSRLQSSSNPETGTISYFYDANGNLAQKTDARGIAITYSYDQLNRLLAKGYSSQDPSACFQYDSVLTGAPDHNPVGHLTAEWTAPSGTCPAQTASGSTATVVTTIPSNGYNSKVILSHDRMGREGDPSLQGAGNQQCPFGSACGPSYVFNYLYDLAGNLTQFNNGISPNSGTNPPIIWQVLNDPVGRILQLSATTPWGNNNSQYPQFLLVNPAYDAFNHLVSEQAAVSDTSSEPGAPGLTVSSIFDSRGRVLQETANGVSVTAQATPSTGVITISGAESEPEQTVAAKPGSTTLTITGADGGHQICSYIPSLRRDICTTVADTGSLSFTANGFTATANYAGGSTDPLIAQALAATLNLSAYGGPGFTATASGNTVTITSLTTGAGSNYPFTLSNGADFSISDPYSTLTGGADAVRSNDAGTVTATITNNSVSPAVSYTTTAVKWGQGDTPSSVASNLAAAINTAAGSLVTATPSAGTIRLTSAATGPATDYAVSVSVSDSMTASYPGLFPTPSFAASAENMEGGAPATYGQNGVLYQYTANSYATNGNLLGSTDTVMGKWSFGYDSLNRLVTASTPQTEPQGVSAAYAGINVNASNTQPTWTYDAFGNRTAETWTYIGTGNGPVMPQSSTPSYTAGTNRAAGFLYDLVGNVLSDGRNVYLYDGEGRLCSVGNSLTGSPSYTQYVYDAEGLRVAKVFTGNTQTCAPPLNSSGQLVAGDTLQKTFLLGPGGEQVTELGGSGNWVHSNVWAGTHLTATYDASSLHFYVTDPLGTRRLQTYGTGVYEGVCASLPYGDNEICSMGDDPTEHHYTGKERDTESGNDYFGARYYSSAMGRFMSPDWSAKVEPVPYAKLDNPQSLNLYAYVGNNPMNRFDSDGHTCWTVLGIPVCVGAAAPLPSQPTPVTTTISAPNWHYSQSSGQMKETIDVTTSSGKAGSMQVSPTIDGGYAGHGKGLNNPASQSVSEAADKANAGPLPQGEYTIGKQQDNVANAGTNHEVTLKASMRLTPDSSNAMGGRGGFLIHGDNSAHNQSASEGCVVEGPAARQTIGSSGVQNLQVEQ